MHCNARLAFTGIDDAAQEDVRLSRIGTLFHAAKRSEEVDKRPCTDIYSLQEMDKNKQTFSSACRYPNVLKRDDSVIKNFKIFAKEPHQMTSRVQIFRSRGETPPSLSIERELDFPALTVI